MVHSDDEDEILTSMNEMNERSEERAIYSHLHDTKQQHVNEATAAIAMLEMNNTISPLYQRMVVMHDIRNFAPWTKYFGYSYSGFLDELVENKKAGNTIAVAAKNLEEFKKGRKLGLLPTIESYEKMWNKAVKNPNSPPPRIVFLCKKTKT